MILRFIKKNGSRKEPFFCEPYLRQRILRKPILCRKLGVVFVKPAQSGFGCLFLISLVYNFLKNIGCKI